MATTDLKTSGCRILAQANGAVLNSSEPFRSSETPVSGGKCAYVSAMSGMEGMVFQSMQSMLMLLLPWILLSRSFVIKSVMEVRMPPSKPAKCSEIAAFESRMESVNRPFLSLTAQMLAYDGL